MPYRLAALYPKLPPVSETGITLTSPRPPLNGQIFEGRPPDVVPVTPNKVQVLHLFIWPPLANF